MSVHLKGSYNPPAKTIPGNYGDGPLKDDSFVVEIGESPT
jgi:hypothetical protein